MYPEYGEEHPTNTRNPSRRRPTESRQPMREERRYCPFPQDSPWRQLMPIHSHQCSTKIRSGPRPASPTSRCRSPGRIQPHRAATPSRGKWRNTFRIPQTAPHRLNSPGRNGSIPRRIRPLFLRLSSSASRMKTNWALNLDKHRLAQTTHSGPDTVIHLTTRYGANGLFGRR